MINQSLSAVRNHEDVIGYNLTKVQNGHEDF